MKKRFDIGDLMIGISFGIGITMIMVALIQEQISYKQGRVDALNGKWKYEMKVEQTQDTTYIKTHNYDQ